jgi:myo-inositol-1(or 4)-monophosphatase
VTAFAEQVAREAGEELRRRFAAAERRGVSSKSTPTDLVSEADLAAEALIRSRLRATCPDDAIVGEEDDDMPGTSGRRWIVDPLDGTVNFLFGIPQWCVSIALEDGDGMKCGVVYDPMRDECWSAVRGGPPLLNGVEVTASGRDELATAMVATGFGYDAAVREVQAAIVARLLPRVRDIRRLGSAALDLAWTAGGRYDAYFERGVKLWDVAAGRLLCERAGLLARELDPVPPAEAGLMIAPPAFADELFGLIAERVEEAH